MSDAFASRAPSEPSIGERLPHDRGRWRRSLMTPVALLYADVSAIIQELLLGIGVLMVILGELLAARQSRLLLRRQRLRHRLCRSHG